MNKEFISAINKTSTYTRLITRYKELVNANTPLPLLVDGVCDGALYSLIYSLCEDTYKIKPAPILILVGEEKKGGRICEFLNANGISAELFPYRDFNFFDMTASHDLEYERLKILGSLASKNARVVVATPDAALQYTVPRERLTASTLDINMNTAIDISGLCRKLTDMGYTRYDQVDGAGQFSVRGGIVDIFTTHSQLLMGKERHSASTPIRIELFGDEIERMATFDVMSQRMKEKIDGFLIAPSKEIIPRESEITEVRAEIEYLLSFATDESSITELKRELSTLDMGTAPFLDRFISLIYKEKECLLDYLDRESPVIFVDTPSVSKRARDSEMIANERLKTFIETNLIPSKYAEISAPVSKIDKFTMEHQAINIDTFLMSTLKEQGGLFRFTTKGISLPNAMIASVLEEASHFSKSKYKTVLVCRASNEAKACLNALKELEIPAFNLKEGDKIENIPEGVVGITVDTYPYGYELPKAKLALIVLSARQRAKTVRSFKNSKHAKNVGERIMSYTDLQVGDYVVHAKYGIGQFLGIQNMNILGAMRDYIAIQYAGTDKLYLPVDQLDMVAKYIGGRNTEGEVRLSKMGGAEWKKATSKARAAARDMAKELIDLYARRIRINGFSCAPDGLMEHEFDTSFEYEETESQLQAIAEIKRDMERPYPMDRVLCGDVGYGKTEVALRAAMKAIANNKQVAILVPTTILAMQHYQTALSRFAGTGVNVGVISRFRTTKDQKRTLKELKHGELDIIIGTHKLLANRVEFKDLGLLIIDEEQRFGVGQKEKIKQMAPDVDVLYLSATPIPRTLSMAMGGIRDMSILDEAPSGRVEVQSYVLEYNEDIINDAIRRELHRGGQVFYLYNNVEYIYEVAGRLKKAFPDASVAVGHGKMDREELEEIWQGLVSGDIDILVSTTIIETGIDIPNANTLIIENADKMGLSQLHQIRGRVGRSHRRAYAFFTYRKDKVLTEIASSRLKAISDFAEFGAGFKIAMRDLEIRGAGNLLGAEQHGHLDAIGYDLYIKILNEAVLEEKGYKVEEKYETKMNISTDAYLPKTYVDSAIMRMDLYKKIAHIENEDDYHDMESELVDRFGKLPRSAKALLDTALVKAYASRVKMQRVEQLKGEVRLYPSEPNLPVLLEISKMDRARVLICGVGKTPYILVKIENPNDFATLPVAVLKKYKEELERLS